MINISDNAQSHFRRLLDTQGSDAAGIRITAVQPGTPTADCRLEFCDQDELRGDELVVECEGFSVFIPAESAAFLEDAEIDFSTAATGGQLTIRAPRLKAAAPSAEAGLVERVRWVLDSEVNPQIASHGGRVQLEEITADGVVVLRFGGGCHGCSQIDVTLKNGVETTLRARIPEVTAVVDATDHSTGSKPYYSAAR